MVLPGSAAEGHCKPEQLLIASLVSCPRPERQGPPRGERNGPGLPGPAAVTAAETPRRRAKLIGVLAPRGCSLFCAEVCGYEGRFPHYSPAASPSAAASPPQRAPHARPGSPRFPQGLSRREGPHRPQTTAKGDRSAAPGPAYQGAAQRAGTRRMQIRGRGLVSTTCSGPAEGIGVGTAAEFSLSPLF